jgi:predicted RNA-binding protein associated with RNAse of E/G family
VKSMPQIRVQKLNLAGEVTWQYEGRVLQRQPNGVTLEAFFNRPDVDFLDLVLKRNDRFVETFYSDRWYNVFEIYDRDSKQLKGWYCNVSRPAVLGEDTVSYVDLALDLWVAANGTQTVLDANEFNTLELHSQDRDQALGALDALQQNFKNQRPPW